MTQSRRFWIQCGLAIAGLAAVAGCTNTDLVDVWRDPGDSPKQMRSLLVIAARRGDAERRLWEDAIAARLHEQGVEAVRSYTVAPNQAPTKRAMARLLDERGLDGALVVTPLVSTAETHWVPGWTSIEPRVYYDPWTRGNVIVNHRVRHRGYRVVDRYARQQITLWTAEDGGRMVWAGTAETPNPGSGADLRDDLAKAIVPVMKKEGFFALSRPA